MGRRRASGSFHDGAKGASAGHGAKLSQLTESQIEVLLGGPPYLVGLPFGAPAKGGALSLPATSKRQAEERSYGERWIA